MFNDREIALVAVTEKFPTGDNIIDLIFIGCIFIQSVLQQLFLDLQLSFIVQSDQRTASAFSVVPTY